MTLLWGKVFMTTTAHDAAGHIHDRSPVLIPPEMRDQWLDPGLTDPGDIRDLLSQVPEPMLQPYEVSMRVNNPQNDGPELVEPSALAG